MRVPEKSTRLAEPGVGIKPEPKNSRKRKKVVTFADPPGPEARPAHSGGASCSSKRRRSRREKTSLRNTAICAKPIPPEKTKFGSDEPPSPEIIELEDGELPSVSQKDPVLEDIKEDAMGKGMSLPQVPPVIRRRIRRRRDR